MALPWLIGGSIFGLGSLLVAALSDDDDPGSAQEEERRRRDAAAQERRRREREEKLANAQTLFAEKGSAIGNELGEVLDEIIHVIPASEAPFTATLGKAGIGIAATDDGRIADVARSLREPFASNDPALEQIVSNLEFHARVYNVHMLISGKFHQKLLGLDEANAELVKLGAIEVQLSALRHRLAG